MRLLVNAEKVHLRLHRREPLLLLSLLVLRHVFLVYVFDKPYFKGRSTITNNNNQQQQKRGQDCRMD
jgi:hypothetical protein